MDAPRPGSCIYCGTLPSDPGYPWGRSCEESPDSLHWSADDLHRTLAHREEVYLQHLRAANRLLIAAARISRAAETRGWRRRIRALNFLPARPDFLDFETEAAKISDTLAVHHGERLPVGPTFDKLEGRS